MAEAALDDLKGAERAAVVLFLLGEDATAEVLKHMGARDVQKLGATMANMHDVSEDHRSAALAQFMDAVGRPSAGSFDSENFIRGVLVKALGDDKAGSLMDRILLDRILLRSKSKGLATLKWMDARSIADIVRNEHPQMVAIVLAYLEREHAADVLALLPEQLRVDVVLRVATLDVTRPDTIEIPDGLRVLVNNAGVDADYLPVEHAPLSLWREIFETNLFGLLEVTRRAFS